MAETETENEPTLPSKRKLDDPINESKQEEQNHSNKSQKLQSPAEEENNKDSQTLEAPLAVNRNDALEAQEDEDEDEDEDDDDDDDVDYEDEAENGEEAVVVDRKGKGIMIEESNDSDGSDDDDDDSSDGSETDGGDSDNEVDEEEENPLAEVDLENILSSRTRRRVVRPGVYIANDNLANKDDDSDDNDA